MREASTSSEVGAERSGESSSNVMPFASDQGPVLAQGSLEDATERSHVTPGRPESEVARTERSTVPSSSRRQPSRSPSNLQQWHSNGSSRGALTTPVLQILERTSATLEHLASERPRPPPHAAEDWVRGACSSSRAFPAHGNRRQRRPSGSASHRCSSNSETPTSRNSPQRKLERYLEVRCGTAEDPQLGATSTSALACSTLGPQGAAGTTTSTGQRTIPTALCSGAMASVLTTESLIALRDDKISSRPPKLIPITTDAALDLIETASDANAAAVWMDSMSSWFNDIKQPADGSAPLQSLLNNASQSLMGPLEAWMGPHEQWSCKAVWKAVSDVYWHGNRHDSQGPPYFRSVE
jgi:hypothetical protein